MILKKGNFFLMIFVLSMVAIFFAASASSSFSRSGLALREACSSGAHYEVVVRLLGRGEFVNTPDDFGQTPLYFACSRDPINTAVVELLLDHGALADSDIIERAKSNGASDKLLAVLTATLLRRS